MHIPAFVFFGFMRRRLALHAEAVHAARELSHGFGTGPGALGRAPTSYHDRSAAAERLGTAPARKRLARTAFRSLKSRPYNDRRASQFVLLPLRGGEHGGIGGGATHAV